MRLITLIYWCEIILTIVMKESNYNKTRTEAKEGGGKKGTARATRSSTKKSAKSGDESTKLGSN